eukprot:scaffold664_cov129-Isochrysis_galbana.AAC.2
MLQPRLLHPLVFLYQTRCYATSTPLAPSGLSCIGRPPGPVWLLPHLFQGAPTCCVLQGRAAMNAIRLSS